MKGKHAIAAARRREREAVEALEAAQMELAEERQARRDAESEVMRLRALEPELERLRSGEHERQTHREEKLRELLGEADAALSAADEHMEWLQQYVVNMMVWAGYQRMRDVPLDVLNVWVPDSNTVVLSRHSTHLSPEVREAYERAKGYRDRPNGKTVGNARVRITHADS